MPRYQGQLSNLQPVRSNAPQLYQSLSQRLTAFSESEETELDRVMAKKAKEKGLIDAQGKTAITLRDGNTIADNAWNEGAVASHVSAVKLDMFENLSRIEAESARAPEAYAAKAHAYSKGLLEGIPPNVRPLVQNELAETVLKSGMKIQSDLRSFQREQHDASITTATDLYQTQAENAAKEGDIMGAVEAHEKAIALIESRELSGLLKPDAAETARRNLTREVEDAGVYGEMGRAITEGRGGAYIREFNSKKSFGDRDPEYRAKMEKQMVSMMKEAHDIDDDQRKREDDERKALWRKSEQELTDLALNNNLTTGALQKYSSEGSADPKVLLKFQKPAASVGPAVSEGHALLAYKLDVLRYSELEIVTDKRLSQEDRASLIEGRRGLEKDKGNWRNSPEGKESVRRISFAFKIPPGADLSKIKDEELNRADFALTQFYNEINQLPLEERQMKSVEVANRIVKDVNAEAADKILADLRARLAAKPYQTIEEVDAADINDVEKDAQRKIIRKYLKKIKETEDAKRL